MATAFPQSNIGHPHPRQAVAAAKARAAFADDVEFLLDAGESVEQIALRMQVGLAAAAKRLYRAERPDLGRRFESARQLCDRGTCAHCGRPGGRWSKRGYCVTCSRRAPSGPVGWSDIGTCRRVLALSAVGWAEDEIAAAAGVSDTSVWRSAMGMPVGPRVRAGIARAFDKLGAQPTPLLTPARQRRVEFAQDRGGVPPLCWDDDALDDPLGEPDLSAIRKPVKHPVVAFEDIVDLINSGVTLDWAMERLNLKRTSIYARLRDAGRLDLYRLLLRNSGSASDWAMGQDGVAV